MTEFLVLYGFGVLFAIVIGILHFIWVEHELTLSDLFVVIISSLFSWIGAFGIIVVWMIIGFEDVVIWRRKP